jgi:hypothetical protein
MGKHNHIGLLDTAKAFYKSGEKLNIGPQWLDAPLPVYFLFLHGVESALKSYLHFRGMDEDGLRKFGHNLEATWQEAMDRGICEVSGECKELRDCIQIINPIYRGIELEYFYPSRKRLPFIEQVQRLSGNLISDLDEFYRLEG